MVLKLSVPILLALSEFENDVEMYGAQTPMRPISFAIWFENDVEMYGAQTKVVDYRTDEWFENDVEMYGAQTHSN